MKCKLATSLQDQYYIVLNAIGCQISNNNKAMLQTIHSHLLPPYYRENHVALLLFFGDVSVLET